MFEFLFQYPRSFFAAGEIIPQTWASSEVLIGLALAAGLAIMASAWFWRSRLSPLKLGTLAILQLAIVALALAMLAQPVLEIEQIRPGDNRVVVLIDTSRSMAMSDDGQQSRLQTAAEQLEGGLLKDLAERGIEVEIRTFDGELSDWSQILDVVASDASPLADQLETALRQASQKATAGLILVSDGADNSEQVDDLRLTELGSFGLPVHSIGVGSATTPGDLQISAVNLPSSAMPNAQITADVTLQSGGAPRNSTLKVYDGDRIIAATDVNLPGNDQITQARVTLPTGGVGVRDLRFELDPAASETNLVNNSFRHTLTVAQDQPRVLYLEGEPRWEYKFARRALDDSGFLFLHGLMQTSVNKTYRQGIESPEQLENGFPTSREELYSYQAIIIGSQAAASLSLEQQQMLRDFVDLRGGSLLMLGGRASLADGGWQNTPVAEVLPVRLEAQGQPTFIRSQAEVVVTEAGQRADWLNLQLGPESIELGYDELPALADYQLVGDLKPGATSLLEVASDQGQTPLLAWQRYGRGKAFVLATGGTWRWQMQLPHQDLTHERFWQSLLREMVTEVPARVSFDTDKTWYRDSDTVRVSATVRDMDFLPAGSAEVRVQARDSSGQTQTIALRPVSGQPGQYEGEFQVANEGLVQLDLTGSLADTTLDPLRHFTRRDDGQLEFFDTRLNENMLRRISDSTGGVYARPNNTDEILDALQFSPAGVTETEWLPLWSMPVNFLLLLILKLGEWGLRRRWGRL